MARDVDPACAVLNAAEPFEAAEMTSKYRIALTNSAGSGRHHPEVAGAEDFYRLKHRRDISAEPWIEMRDHHQDARKGAQSVEFGYLGVSIFAPQPASVFISMKVSPGQLRPEEPTRTT
jgi:hypothetical protein